MKKKIVAALDVDNTLFADSVITSVAKLYGLSLPTDFYLNDWPAIYRDEALELFKNKRVMGSLEPNDGAYELLESLSDEVSAYAVTSRPKVQRDLTISMIYRRFGCKVESVICAGGYDKTGIYKKLKADIVLDDNAEHIIQGLNAGAELSILLSHDGTPYNWKFREDVVKQGGQVVSSLNEARILIQGYLVGRRDV